MTKSYNSSDVVRDLVSALQNYSQSPDTCKSLSFSNNQTWPRWRLCLVQWMYQAFFRHVQNYNMYLIFLYFKASFSTVELGCTAFNVWSMAWFFIKFWYFFFLLLTVDTEMMKQLYLDLKVSNISINMMKDMMHLTFTSPGSVSSGFSWYQIVF